MNELSTEAVEAINAILSEPRNLDSQSIDLYRYARDKVKYNTNKTILNDIYEFLTEKSFVTSNNPFDNINKFLVTYTSEGRKLHRAGSLSKYYNKRVPLEQQILVFLEPKYEPEKNRLIQKSLEVSEAEFEKTMRLLLSRGFTYYEEICDGNFMDCGFSSISPEGRKYIGNLKNPQSSFDAMPTIIGNGNFLTIAHNGDVHQSNISIMVIENYNYDSLKDVGLTQLEINELKEIVNSHKGKPTYKTSILKWLGETVKQVATKGVTDNLPKLIESVGNLI